MPPPAAAAANASVPEASVAQPASKPPGGKKKLLVMLLVVALVLAAAGVGAVLWLKKRAAAHDQEDGDTTSAETMDAKAEKFDPKMVPTFVALETFTVNLADREAERYAQIGVTLELTDAKAGELIKNYMPAIRNNILMVLAHKTSQELLEREGKQRLAAEIMREAMRPLGYDMPAEGQRAKAADDNPPPVRRVHFSNFIIQ